MPAFVKHEKDWQRARKEADKQDITKKGDKYWKYVTSIYKKMHPEDFSKAAKEYFSDSTVNSDTGSTDSFHDRTVQHYDIKDPVQDPNKSTGYDFSKVFSGGIKPASVDFKWQGNKSTGSLYTPTILPYEKNTYQIQPTPVGSEGSEEV